MKRLPIHVLAVLTLISLGLVYPRPVPAGDAYLKARAKSLSNRSENYNYTRIRNNAELKEKSDQVGMDLRGKTSGYGTVLNYTEISNVSADINNISDTSEKHSASSLLKGKISPKANIGIIMDSNASGKVTNVVEVKDSKINSGLLGNTVNSGVMVEDDINYAVHIKNRTTIEDSQLGGAIGILDN